MANKLISYALAVRNYKRFSDILSSAQYTKERQTALIIRLIHSIEKGLCLENPRLGFGSAKLEQLISLCGKYAEQFGSDEFCLKMARDVIKAYIDFHNARGFQNEDLLKICEAYKTFLCKEQDDGEVFGGTIHVTHNCELSIEQLESFFASRHSVRDFQGTDVSNEAITKAICAAQYAPSACNRQAVRAYVLPSAKICELYSNSLAGIGGFAQNADKFILITGKVSAYDKGEYNQHIVSASIFATYLVEALFAQNIGSCMVQRPLSYSTQWENIAKAIGAPGDEQLVLMIAIGNLKDEYDAPVSKRYPYDHIVKFID